MTRVTQLIHDAGKYLLISVYPLPTHPTHNCTHKNGGNLETLPGWPKKLQHNRPARSAGQQQNHDDVIKWKHCHRCIPHTKGQWRGALMFTLISARINGWVNNRGASDLRRHRTHYDVTAMILNHYCPFEAEIQRCPVTPLNTLRPRQKGRHFAGDTSKRIFLKENGYN